MTLQETALGSRGVLAAAVGMVDQPEWWISPVRGWRLPSAMSSAVSTSRSSPLIAAQRGRHPSRRQWPVVSRHRGSRPDRASRGASGSRCCRRPPCGWAPRPCRYGRADWGLGATGCVCCVCWLSVVRGLRRCGRPACSPCARIRRALRLRLCGYSRCRGGARRHGSVGCHRPRGQQHKSLGWALRALCRPVHAGWERGDARPSSRSRKPPTRGT
jgi:hypothetical protein